MRLPAPAGLALAGVILCFAVSANLLTWVGIPYVTEGGPLALKIHPGTLLISLSAALSLRHKNDARPATAITLFLCAMAFCVADALATTGSGIVIVFIDTFIPAGLLAIAWRDLTDAQRAKVLTLIELALACNALLAVAEAATQSHLIPLYLDGAEARMGEADFRPTALYDHPLTGAALTMIGMLLPPPPRHAPFVPRGISPAAGRVRRGIRRPNRRWPHPARFRGPRGPGRRDHPAAARSTRIMPRSNFGDGLARRSRPAVHALARSG